MKKLLVVLLFLLSFISVASAGDIRRPSQYSGGPIQAPTNGSDGFTSQGGAWTAGLNYSRIVLHIDSACDNYGDGCGVAISTDAGTSWMYFHNDPLATSMWGRTNVSYELPPDSNLANLRVTFTVSDNYQPDTCRDPPDCTQWDPGWDHYGVITVYDVYTDGTAGTAPAKVTYRATGSGTWPAGWANFCGTYNYTGSPGALPNAWDTDVNTYSSESVSSTGGAGYSNKVWVVAAHTGPFTTKPSNEYFERLTVKYSCTNSGYYAGSLIYYSLNTGTTWNYLTQCYNNTGATEASIVLPPNQDTSAMYVGVCGRATTGYSSPYTASTNVTSIYDARVEAYPQLTAPATPGTPSFGAQSYSSKQVVVNWADNANNEDSYAVYRCSGASCSPTGYTGVLGAGTQTYTDTGVSPNTVYGYQACATNGAGTTCSATAYITTYNVPSTPAISATPAANGLSNSVSWSATNATSYNIDWCQGIGCNGYSALWTGTALTSNTHSSLTPGQVYRYRNTPINAWGSGSATNTSDTVMPNYPQSPGIGSTPNANGVQAAITWGATGATTYTVGRCTGSGCSSTATPVWSGTALTSNTNTGLTPGTIYRWWVYGTNAVGNSSTAWTGDITMPNYAAVPAAPTATPAANGLSVGLTWSAASGATSYKLYSCSGSSSCTSWALDQSPAGTSATDSSLTACTYYRYYLTSVNAVGESGAGSITTTQTPCIPAPPSNLVATPAANGIDINYVFTDNSSNETGFTWQWCAGTCDSGGSWQAGGNISGSPFATTASPGTTYTVRLQSYNAVGASAWTYSNTFTLPNYPAAPISFSVTNVYSTKVTLNWTDNSTTESVFNIRRCVGSACTPNWVRNNGGSTTVATTGTPYTFVDDGLTAGTQYCWAMTAYNAVGDSAPTTTICGTTQSIPPQISGVVLTPTTDGRGMKIDWANPGGSATHIAVHYCVGNNCAGDIFQTDVALPTLTYTHTGLTPGVTYTWRLFSFNANDNPIYYNSMVNYVGTTIDYPKAPTGLSATPQANGTMVDIAWTNGTTGSNPTETQIWTCVGNGCTPLPGGQGAVTGLSTALTAYTLSGMSTNTTYGYNVVGCNAVGCNGGISYYFTTAGPPGAASITATPTGSTSVLVTWTDVAGETSYQMYRCSGNGCTPTVAQGASQPAGTISFVDAGLTPGTSYSYKLRAINAAGNTDSNTAAAGTWGRLRRGSR